jgi:DNA-binding response OmpR family regulator
MQNAVRVLVVDDDAPVRDAIGIAFRSEGFDVCTEPDGRAIRQVFDSFHPDLAILDVRLPAGPDGYAIARMLRDQSDVPILLLTAADRVQDRLRGFESGADDHLGKPFSVAELLARAQALLRRSARLPGAEIVYSDLCVDPRSRRVLRAGSEIELTRTEFDLLDILLRHQGQILSKQQLLAQVWGFDAFDPNVVEVHISALRRKLEVLGPRLVHTVRSVGYILR